MVTSSTRPPQPDQQREWTVVYKRARPLRVTADHYVRRGEAIVFVRDDRDVLIVWPEAIEGIEEAPAKP